MTAQADLFAPLAPRIPRANVAVLHHMLHGGWWTLAQLAERTHLSENTISTRISENARKWGYGYTKRKAAKHYEYALIRSPLMILPKRSSR